MVAEAAEALQALPAAMNTLAAGAEAQEVEARSKGGLQAIEEFEQLAAQYKVPQVRERSSHPESSRSYSTVWRNQAPGTGTLAAR